MPKKDFSQVAFDVVKQATEKAIKVDSKDKLLPKKQGRKSIDKQSSANEDVATVKTKSSSSRLPK